MYADHELHILRYSQAEVGLDQHGGRHPEPITSELNQDNCEFKISLCYIGRLSQKNKTKQQTRPVYVCVPANTILLLFHEESTEI